jgi:hypothetical protein
LTADQPGVRGRPLSALIPEIVYSPQAFAGCGGQTTKLDLTPFSGDFLFIF